MRVLFVGGTGNISGADRQGVDGGGGRGGEGFRPGMVSVVQTFGEGAKSHPHVHALCSRGGWAASGEWIPLPYVDEGAAEKLFRHKVLALLRRRGLLSQERIGEPLPAALHSRLARGRLRAQGGTRRHRTDRGREDRRDGVRGPGPRADPGPQASSRALLRRLLERHPRQAQEGRRLGRALLSGPGARGCSDTGRTVPRRPPAPVGGTDPPRLRSRRPYLSSLRKRDARDRLHQHNPRS